MLLNASDGAEWARKQAGGAAVDEAFAIAAEGTVGDFFVAGTTGQSDAFGATVGVADVFVLRLSADTLADSLGVQDASAMADRQKRARLAPAVLIPIVVAASLLAVCILLSIGYYWGKVRTELKYEQFRQREDDFDDSAAPGGGPGRITAGEPTRSLSQVLPAATALELLTRPQSATAVTPPTGTTPADPPDEGVRGPKSAWSHQAE